MSVSRNAVSGLAEVNGSTLYYEVTGQGQPLVLLHAGIANLRMWDNQVMAFSDHYQVIRYDLRGMGRSAVPTTPYSHEEDLRALLAYLNVEQPAILLGLSFGGRTALNFTLEHPEQVKGLILANSALAGYEFGEENQKLWAEIDEVCERGDLDRASELETLMWVVGPDRTREEVDPVVFRLIEDWNRENLRLGLSEGVVDPLQPDPPAIQRLGEIQTPTLVISSDKDVHDVQTVAELLSREIPGARKVVIANAAHIVNLEQPAAFNQAVQEFLEHL